MESNTNNHTIAIKDKQGVYFLAPFQDKNTKLLNIPNANTINISSFLAVIYVNIDC